jgi:soluble lytic murein transglycosylase
MQVLDGTNTDPGFGVKPARDNSPEERARVGRDYLQAMLKRYQGDPALVWAAYNAGPGRVDAALKNAGKPVMVDANTDPNAPKQISWLSLMPEETQNYVAKNMAALSGGQGTPPRPTLADLSAQLASDPRLAGNPQRLKIAQEEAARQWKLQEDAIKQREEEGTSNAMRMLVSNGGRFADLPASVRNAIPPKEVDNVLNFSSRVAKGEDITSPLLYASLSSNPAELARMSDAQFFMLRRELSESDFKHFANERAKQMGGAQGANGPGDLNSAAIKQTLDARMRVLGMDPTPKDDGGADAARIGAVRQFVDQYFVAAQREAGKKFTDAEVSQHIDALFAKNATFRGWFSDSSGPVLGMKIGDINSSAKDSIKAAFKRRGVDSPTDAQILNAYWNMKFARK